MLKKNIFIFALLMVFALSWNILDSFGTMRAFCAEEDLNPNEVRLLKERLIPSVQSISMKKGMFRFEDSMAVELFVSTEKELSESYPSEIKSIFNNWFKCNPNIKISRKEVLSGKVKGAYTVQTKVDPQVLLIEGVETEGIGNALKTLRQLAEPIPGTKRLTGYFIPPLAIEDAPAVTFRGIHLCWFPETLPERIEQGIRIAAYYKFNYCVLELWGVYPFKSFPDFCWAEHKTNEKEIRRLVKLGKELGITLIPQFNLFGHASASRIASGKHVVLDFHEEYAPLFEPDGWTWCLSNPETRTVLSNIVLELMDLFDNPPYFHLGCDEADSAATCSLCRNSDYVKLFQEHLMQFHKILAERGARPMMWHDMLIRRGDPRWTGYVVNGTAKTTGLLDKLSKDFIICDWQYGAPKKDEKWPTLRYFQENKFDVLACPWNNVQGLRSLGDFVRKEKSFGLLCTTWHYFFADTMRMILVNGSSAGWGVPQSDGNIYSAFNSHLRQVGWDAKVSKYEATGRVELQVYEKNLPK